MTAAEAGLTGADFKAAMSAFASGVTVVTAKDADGRPHGFTASAFCSVSLEPPLVSVCVARSARCHGVFAGCEEFAVSVLGTGQARIATHFASKAEDKFAGMPLRETGTGQVVVDGALAVLDCRVRERHTAGDHTILIGLVRVVENGRGTPLVFHNRAFHSLVPEVGDNG